MDSLIVKLYYDPEKWDSSKNYTLASVAETPTRTRSLPSKIVKLQYSARKRPYDSDGDNSPSRSSHRHRTRTPTPPGPEKLEIILVLAAEDGGYRAQRQAMRQDLLKRTYQESLQSMKKYQEEHLLSSLSDYDLENAWYYDLQNVSLRLHYLREVYKAIQTLKKRRAHNRDHRTVVTLQSSNMGTPLALEDEGSGGGSAPILQLLQHEDDESSGSNTDQNSRDLGKRASRRRVQFHV